jgi:hypothetical protein
LRGKLQVPKSQEEALASLINLPARDAEAFEKGLRGAAHNTSIRALASSIAQISGLADTVVYPATRALASLYTMMDRLETPIEEFLSEIERAAQATSRDDLKSPAFGWDEARARLRKFLSFDRSLGFTAKAFDLLTDNERVFCDARVISDVRPIFLKDVDHSPDAFILLHTLHLEYHKAGGQLESLDVSMDSNDVQYLLKALERARGKEASLRDLAERMDLPVVRATAHED